MFFQERGGDKIGKNVVFLPIFSQKSAKMLAISSSYATINM